MATTRVTRGNLQYARLDETLPPLGRNGSDIDRALEELGTYFLSHKDLSFDVTQRAESLSHSWKQGKIGREVLHTND